MKKREVEEIKMEKKNKKNGYQKQKEEEEEGEGEGVSFPNEYFIFYRANGRGTSKIQEEYNSRHTGYKR